MVGPSHTQLSIKTRCQLLSLSRSGWYYDSKGESPLPLKLMRLLDKHFLATPYYGSRQMARWVRRQEYGVGRPRGQRLMALRACTRCIKNRAPASLTRTIGFILISSDIWLFKRPIRSGVQILPTSQSSEAFLSGGDHGLAEPERTLRALV